jgi:predicted phosphodiesterase
MKIRMVGDVHGNHNRVEYLMEKAGKANVDKVVLLGDVGLYWNGTDGFEQFLSDLAYVHKVPIYVLDGNHENHGQLEKYHDAEEMVVLADNLFYLPRGFSWEWSGRKFLSIGGAFSIDYMRRIPGVSWWEDEVPNAAQINRAIDVGKVDFVLAHDAPIQAEIPFLYPISAALEARSEKNRKAMGAVLESASPKRWYHGHYHQRYNGYVTLPNGVVSGISGLGYDYSDISDHYVDLTI